MKTTTLFQIQEWYRQLGELLTAQGGETSDTTDLLEKAIADNESDTINSLLLMAHEAEAQAGLYKQQVDTFNALQADCIGKAERLRGYVEAYLSRRGIQSYPLPLFPKLGIKKLPDTCEVAKGAVFTADIVERFPSYFKTETTYTVIKDNVKKHYEPVVYNEIGHIVSGTPLPDGITVVTNRTGLTGETIKAGKEQ